MGMRNGVAALLAGLPLIAAVAIGIPAARAASPTGTTLGSAASPSPNRAEGWATRFEAIQPHCLRNQTWLGAPAAEAVRTCSCTIREIVSRSTDRQLELLLIISNDLVMLFIGLEILSIGLYILAGFARGNQRSEESAMKYFLLGSFALAAFVGKLTLEVMS